jgi:hypothetical protein
MKINMEIDLDTVYTSDDETVAALIRYEVIAFIKKAVKQELKAQESKIRRLVQQRIQTGSLADLKKMLGEDP